MNNVGTNVRSLTQDYKDNDYHSVIATNLDSAFLITKVCCFHKIQRSNSKFPCVY